MINTWINKIELKFWDAMIPLMSTSQSLQIVMKTTYGLFHDQSNRLYLSLIAAASFGGILVGFLLALSTVHLW
jgi:hypothetical protein